MKKNIIFYLIFTSILFACIPQEVATPKPIVASPTLTITSIPTQTIIRLEETPPDYLAGSIEKAYIPEDAIAYLSKNYFKVFKTLSDLGFVPVFGNDSVFVFVGPDDKHNATPLETFSDPLSGELFNLTDNVDPDGIAHYQSANGAIDKWGIMSIWCRTVCVQAMSYNQEDDGQVFWLEINPSSGQLVGYFPVFYDERPQRDEKTQHLEINGKMIWFMPVLDKWNDPLMGKNALWKMNGVMGVSYEFKDNDGILTFISDGEIHLATNEEIYWQADFGGYVFNQEGVFVWDEESLEWIKSRQLIDENISDNAKIFLAGEKKFVFLDGKMRIVTSIEKDENLTIISISANEGQKFFWDLQNWEVWYPEKTIREIPVCESMYDILTPRNELNPDHIVEATNLQAIANWVQTQLTEDMFDLSKIKLLTDVRMSTISGLDGEMVVPNVNTAPNYKDPLTAPFLKDNHWCASTKFDDKSYLVIFVPYYIPQVPANELPVIVGIRELPLAFRGAWYLGIESYLEDMNVVPWYINSASTQLAMQYFDPYTGENFTRDRIQQIFSEMRQGDFSHTHGLVLYFDIGRNSGGWYE